MPVCTTCLESAAAEMDAASKDCELVCTAFGDEIVDHLCEELEYTGSPECSCACNGIRKHVARGERLLTEELKAMLPPLRSTEALGLDAPIVVKFFTPTSNWTWYATEFDGEDTFFGLVDGMAKEMGYFSLRELSEVIGPLGLGVERDLYFGTKHTLREFM